MLVGFVMGFFVFALIVVLVVSSWEKANRARREEKRIKYEMDEDN